MMLYWESGIKSYICVYIKYFLNKNTEIEVTKLLQWTSKLGEKNHFRKLCHLSCKNTRVKIAALIILLRSYQAEIDLNIEYYMCQVPAQYRSLHGRIPKFEMIVVQKHYLTL